MDTLTCRSVAFSSSANIVPREAISLDRIREWMRADPQSAEEVLNVKDRPGRRPLPCHRKPNDPISQGLPRMLQIVSGRIGAANHWSRGCGRDRRFLLRFADQHRVHTSHRGRTCRHNELIGPQVLSGLFCSRCHDDRIRGLRGREGFPVGMASRCHTQMQSANRSAREQTGA
jgi:hypothetical protein